MPGMQGRGDQSDVGLMAGLSLPLWRGRIHGARDEAAASYRATARDRDDLRNRLRAELSTAVFQFRDAERRQALFADSLVPKAQAALAAAMEAYASGQAGFMTLIDAQRTLLEFQVLAERASVDREIAIGALRYCMKKETFHGMDRTGPSRDREKQP